MINLNDICIRGRRWFLIFFLVFSMTSCASYTEKMQQVQLLYRSGQFDQALKKLEESGLAEDDDSRLLYRLEKGMILDRMGKSAEARSEFKIADRIGDDLYTVRLRKEALSLITSDAFTDYSGEDFELVAIHIAMALSFIQDGKIEPALVEARAINTKLNAINTEYDQDAKNTYAEDAFARYLAGAIHESQKNWDSAIVDYQKALAVYESYYRKDFSTPVPDSLVLALLKLYKKRGRKDKYNELLESFSDLKPAHMRQMEEELGEILVIHEVGHIARKTRSEAIFNWGNQIVRMSFPKIIYRPRTFGNTGVRVMENRQYFPAEKVQDMSAIAAKTLEERGGRIFLKNAARIAAKGQLNKEASKQFGGLGGLAVNLFNVATETADTRSWTSLPAQYQITRVALPPGKYDLKITSEGVVERVTEIKLQKGELKIIRAFSPDGQTK